MEYERTYTAPELARIAGISYRQMDVLCRKGLVPGIDPTPGSGQPRRFTEAQKDHVLALVARKNELLEELRALGFYANTSERNTTLAA